MQFHFNTIVSNDHTKNTNKWIQTVMTNLYDLFNFSTPRQIHFQWFTGLLQAENWALIGIPDLLLVQFWLSMKCSSNIIPHYNDSICSKLFSTHNVIYNTCYGFQNCAGTCAQTYILKLPHLRHTWLPSPVSRDMFENIPAEIRPKFFLPAGK